MLRPMADTHIGDGNARKLERYWTAGPGLAKWATSPHPWSTLVAHLSKHMSPAHAKGLASNYFHRVFGIWPGERKGANPVGRG